MLPTFIPNSPETLFADQAFPCNPRPFTRRIDELCEAGGTPAIRSDAAKACLWVLMAQAYGQLASIDLCEEWDRLYRALNRARSTENASDNA